jgi:hypothetical protein
MSLDWHTGWLSTRLRFPHIRQELVELTDGRGGEVGQDAGEVTLGVDGVAFGAGDESGQDRGDGPRSVAASGGVRPPPYGLRPNTASPPARGRC